MVRAGYVVVSFLPKIAAVDACRFGTSTTFPMLLKLTIFIIPALNYILLASLSN
jgi:hypothetical protein